MLSKNEVSVNLNVVNELSRLVTTVPTGKVTSEKLQHVKDFFTGVGCGLGMAEEWEPAENDYNFMAFVLRSFLTETQQKELEKFIKTQQEKADVSDDDHFLAAMTVKILQHLNAERRLSRPFTTRDIIMLNTGVNAALGNYEAHLQAAKIIRAFSQDLPAGEAKSLNNYLTVELGETLTKMEVADGLRPAESSGPDSESEGTGPTEAEDCFGFHPSDD